MRTQILLHRKQNCNKYKFRNVLIMYSQQQIIDMLALHGIRPSVQRIAILGFMLKTHEHPTADEIYLALSPSIPTLSKTTVYNVLKNFSDAGVVNTLNIDGKNIRYDAFTDDHAHLKCEQCERVFDLPCASLYKREIEGFRINRAHTYYWGTCPECLMQEKTNEDS